MSETLHIVCNKKESNDKVAVIFQGELVYNGGLMNGTAIYKLFKELNGAAEYIKFHDTTDKGMEKPDKVVYPDE